MFSTLYPKNTYICISTYTILKTLKHLKIQSLFILKVKTIPQRRTLVNENKLQMKKTLKLIKYKFYQTEHYR